MALTLAEGSKLSNDVLLKGVVETIVKESPILQRMPFIEIVGNGLTYNKENALPTIGYRERLKNEVKWVIVHNCLKSGFLPLQIQRQQLFAPVTFVVNVNLVNAV